MNILKKIGKFILDLVEIVTMALAIFVVMYLVAFQPHQVKGHSMDTSLHDKEYLLTDKLSYKFGAPKRGDVVIFKAPTNAEYDYIKRVIGIPGDTVMVKDSRVYVNGVLVQEGYLDPGITTEPRAFLQEGMAVTVPANNLIAMGDNRPGSSDSRDWGFVPYENIIGKAFLRYWPLNEIKIIPRVKYQQ